MATIHDFARMCNYYEHCADCPFNINGYDCDNYLARYPDEATKTIDKWIAEHPIPIKTYASNFYEKFPNASRTVRGYPDICLKYAYGGDCSCDTLVHPNENDRERYDNNANTVNSIATLSGATISLIFAFDLATMFVFALIGNIIDNFFYLYIYNKLQGE